MEDLQKLYQGTILHDCELFLYLFFFLKKSLQKINFKEDYRVMR